MAQKKQNKTARNIDFLFEVGSLRSAQRAWAQLFGGLKTASNLEHSMRVALLALIIAEGEGGADEGKILKMALFHDLPEARTVDHAHVHKAYVEENEAKAVADTFGGTSIEVSAFDVLKEYKERISKESRIVKDADNIDIDLELRELEDRGSKVPAKWRHLRKQIRENKLYTKTARELWDAIQKSNPDNWQTVANQWLSGKKNGK
jgi:putative hydrolase of HD superfamily